MIAIGSCIGCPTYPFVSPGIAPSFSATCCKFPFFFGRQSSARPLRISVSVIPSNACHRSSSPTCWKSAILPLRWCRIVLFLNKSSISLTRDLVLVDEERFYCRLMSRFLVIVAAIVPHRELSTIYVNHVFGYGGC